MRLNTWTARCLAFPAHAGINRARPPFCTRILRVPRPRGDQPCDVRCLRRASVRSPPTRGSTARERAFDRSLAAFPAHAGINRYRFFILCGACGVPRPRGDQPTLHLHTNFLPKRSPPTRGSTADDTPDTESETAFPAHAGINRDMSGASLSVRCVPRPRGDQPDQFSLDRAEG